MMIRLVAGLIAVGAMAGVYQKIKWSGVKQERARVENVGKKVDAKAQKARAAAAIQPDGVLRKYYRD